VHGYLSVAPRALFIEAEEGTTLLFLVTERLTTATPSDTDPVVADVCIHMLDEHGATDDDHSETKADPDVPTREEGPPSLIAISHVMHAQEDLAALLRWIVSVCLVLMGFFVLPLYVFVLLIATLWALFHYRHAWVSPRMLVMGRRFLSGYTPTSHAAHYSALQQQQAWQQSMLQAQRHVKSTAEHE